MNIAIYNTNRGRTKTIGYWIAQEQYSMENLLIFVAEAERCGFNITMTSDHFHPWWHVGGYGNFTWIWIAAAAERTKKMKFVTGVTAPVYRYHPAIIAQAFASLDVLYPGRIGLGLGTGEAMNELPLGYEWPKSSKVRLTKTTEAIQVIRKLWNERMKGKQYGDCNDISSNYVKKDGFTDFNGQYFLIRQAKLYTPPTSPHIPIYLAAAGPQSAKAAGKFSDGMITFLKPHESSKVIDTFNDTAKKENKNLDFLEKIAEYKISFSEDYEKAFESAGFWRATLIKDVFGSIISDPRKLQEKANKEVSNEQLIESIQIVTSIEDSIKSIEEYFRVGYTAVYVHSTSPNEIKFVHEFSKKVLPYFNTKDF
ncbi:MAG: LLM class flavin-dependent oxidoreductase [Thaumarchaeota archaeon]|nr:MAG: LLM class flavin-dependent oxidoreductase [Nitrososphaerota archaeon]TLX91257.1 MAG: LLM class flavin-dependent oxidoreductase [Nitrososphaerota archaeon]